MDEKTESLKAYLFENLTAKDWFLLSNTLKISDTKLSRLLSGTDCWNNEPFKALVKIMKVNPTEILHRFELKNNITVNQMDDIIKEYENN